MNEEYMRSQVSERVFVRDSGWGVPDAVQVVGWAPLAIEPHTVYVRQCALAYEGARQCRVRVPLELGAQRALFVRVSEAGPRLVASTLAPDSACYTRAEAADLERLYVWANAV